MSCSGCRILRKGCSDACVLRPSIQWIDGADAQANAIVFVAKFVGRSTLLAFLASVPSPRRPLAFRSLLYEACGRTVNPVNGAVGLLWTGNWHVCQAAVETVLTGGVVRPMQEPVAAAAAAAAAEVEELYWYQKTPPRKRGRRSWSSAGDPPAFDLDLCLMPASPEEDNWQASTPSESSVTTTTTMTMSTMGSGGDLVTAAEEPTLLSLFV